MRRRFSTFPEGRSGAGLLLLRLCAGSITFAKAALVIERGTFPTASATLAVISIIAAACLVLGFMTAGASTALATAAAVTAFVPATSPDYVESTAALLLVTDAAALILLGPGAYSLDARLFGRREILVDIETPRRKR